MSLRRILLPIAALVLSEALCLGIKQNPAFAQSPIAPPLDNTSSVASKPLSGALAVIANLLPTDTAGIMLLNANDNAWQTLSRFGLFPPDTAFPSTFYPTDLGINFYTDVRPWLGDQVAIALLPGANATNNRDRSVIIAAIKDATQIPRFLERVKSARKQPAIVHEHKGVTILEWEPQTLTPDLPVESQPQALSWMPGRKSVAALQRTPLAQTESLPLPKNKPTPSDEAIPEQPPDATASPYAPQKLAIAVLPNCVVSSTSVEAIKQLIDSQAEGKRLADNPLFQRTVRQPAFQRSLIAGYGNYAQIFAAATALNQAQINALPPGFPTPPKLDPTKTDILGRYYDAIDGYLWAEPNGMHMQVGIHFKQPIPESLISSMSTPNQILQRLPEVNYVVSNSQNLAMFWRVLTTGLESEPSLRRSLEQFRQVSQTWLGFDDRDIFPWMNGEYATFLYPTRQGFIPSLFPKADMGFGLMIQTRDRPAAEAALNKLDQAARTRIRSDVVTVRKLQGQPVVTWNLPINGKQQSFLAHGWVDEDTVLVLGGGGAIAEFSPKPLRSLPQSANFKAAIAPFSDSNLGYFYVNGGAVMSLVNSSLLPLATGGRRTSAFDEITTPLSSIRSVSGASSITANKVQSQGFLALATTRTTPITASELIKLGEQKVAQGKAEAAIGSFTRALTLEPDNLEAYSKRGETRFLAEDIQGAIDDYTQVLRLDPNQVETYYRRAQAKSQLFDYLGALADIDQSIQMDADETVFYDFRAHTRLIVEDYQGAIADANQVLQMDAENSSAYNARCYARARGLGDFKAALTDCDKAIALNSEDAASLTSRCYVRAKLGDSAALTDCDKAIELDPGYEYSYEDRGLAKVALGDKKGGLADLQTALEQYQQQGDRASQQRVEKVIQTVK